MATGDHDDRLRAAAAKYSNWGKWGPDDQLGTVNYITPELILEAASLIRSGSVFSLTVPYGQSGPQSGRFGRFNPILMMLRDGTDVYARDLADTPRGVGAADDVVIIPTQSGTHWDGLSHVFYDSRMWNGYDCRLVSSFGAERNDITNYTGKIIGRAVLLDFPRLFGVSWCEPGRAIGPGDLTRCCTEQRVEVRRGDILLLRFGQMAMHRADGSWDGFAGGDAPGLSFDTLSWIHEREVAGVAADTWGVEVRPNELGIAQPWHRVAIPQMGLLVGEIFDLDELAEHCAADGVYEMFFTGSPLPIERSVGGLVSPLAVK